jgi:hypothetical protein
VSQQDTRDLRIRRRPQEILDAPLLSQLSSKLLKELEKLRLGIGVLGPASVGAASAELLDAKALERTTHSLLSRRRVDAVVTSPPYANALPYIDTDRLSLLILGLLSPRARYALQKRIIGNREIHGGDRRRLELEMLGPQGLQTFPPAAARQIRKVLIENQRHPVGFRRRNVPALLFQYFRDMRGVMARLYEVVRPGGSAFMVLGDSTTTLGNGCELAIRTTEHISALAEQVGWKATNIEPITVTVEDVAHIGHAITDNYILTLHRGRSL